MKDAFRDALAVEICSVGAVQVHETKCVFRTTNLEVAGGNDGSLGTLDDEVVFRITSDTENLSTQAIGGFAQRSVASSERSLKLSVFSRRLDIHEEKRWR